MASVVTIASELANLLADCDIHTYDAPPLSLYTVELPCSFVMPASITNTPVSICSGRNDTFTLALVVAVQSAGQSTQLDNYNDLLSWIDTVNDALKSASFTGISYHEWQIIPQDQRPIIIDTTPYWGLTAVVTMHGG